MTGLRLTVVLVLILACSLGQAVTLDYCTLLRNLVDLDRLPQIEPGVTCREWTSFDRNEYQHPGANGDAGQYIRVEPNGEAVMAEMTGPGCIVRLWSANPQGKIRFYLDGATTPTYEFDFDQLFRGGIPPFKTPVVYKQSGVQSASDCYLPIPYAKSCKVTADKKWGQYYHVWFRTYPADWQVPTFRLPLSDEEMKVLDSVCTAWTQVGERPLPATEGAQVTTRRAMLDPGEALDLPLRGPGIVQAVKIRADGDEPYLWRKMWLEANWDEETSPSIAAPLDGFFGTGFQANEYKALPAGVIGGQGYLYFPMPFRKSAHFRLINQGHHRVTAEIEVTAARETQLPPDMMVFRAKWRREQPATTFDYPFLEATGAGRVVGVSLNIDNPMPGWWGEGDEKMWVDGRSWDEIIGTGSEDYFGDAWGLHYFQQPFFGASYLQGTRTCAYRWHIVDNVPFTQSMKFTIENYPPFRPDYTSTCFWYAKADATDFFTPANDYALRRPWGKSLVNTIEAEDLKGLGGTIITDDDRPTEFSHGLAVDLGQKAIGDQIGPAKVTVAEDDVYYPVAHLAAEGTPAALDLSVDGQVLHGDPAGVAKGMIEFTGLALTKGEHELKLQVTAAGRLILDCLQLRPSPKPWNVAEAENLKVVGTSGPQTKIETARLMWGHGRQLAFPATQVGDSFTVEVPGGRGQVSLGAAITRGPDYGDWQAFVGDQPLGRVISGYSATPTTTAVTLGAVDLTKAADVTIRVVGKNAAATDYGVGVDYFTFAPIVVPNAIEAEDLKVVECVGGGYSRQELGDRFSGGTQLWFTSSKPDGHITVELPVAKDGDYEVNVYFCTSWDYATVQVYLDDQKLGEPLDNYTAGVEARGKTSLGAQHLTAGTHRLKLQSVGKNELSKGYYMGLDAIQLIVK